MLDRLTWFSICFVLVVLLSCAPKTAPATSEPAKRQEVLSPAARTGWEVEWEQVQREARKEGTVVLYTTGGTELRQVFSRAMKQYGIEMESISGRGTELSERMLRERKAGIYNVDLYMSGLDTFINVLKPANMVQPLESLFILPEVKDPKAWYKGQINFADKDKTILAFVGYLDPGIHVNTDMVKQGDISSMQDLLSPRWKGKIIMDDPTTPGRGSNWMSVVAIRMGEDYIKRLAEQTPLLTRDRRQLADWVAKGRYPVGIGVYPDQYMEYKRAGAPIDNIPLKEASYLLGGIGFVSFVDRSPHPNASRVFLNWLLTREGQIAWQEVRNDQSARVDTPVDHLIKTSQPVRLAQEDYYDSRQETWQTEIQPKAQKIVIEHFRSLVK